MRKIVAGLFMSLDGVVESPSTWASPYLNDEVFEWIGAGLPDADAILLGRRTYLEFAQLWSSQGSSVPMAKFLNTTPKYIVSSTLDTVDWGPASLLHGDLAGGLGHLKQQPGKNVQIPGSPTLVRSCSATGSSMSSASGSPQSCSVPGCACSMRSANWCDAAGGRGRGSRGGRGRLVFEKPTKEPS
jgi:dihydrofolate reductase